MEKADLINNMVSAVPTYESNASGTQNNREKNISVSRMPVETKG